MFDSPGSSLSSSSPSTPFNLFLVTSLGNSLDIPLDVPLGVPARESIIITVSSSPISPKSSVTSRTDRAETLPPPVIMGEECSERERRQTSGTETTSSRRIVQNSHIASNAELSSPTKNCVPLPVSSSIVSGVTRLRKEHIHLCEKQSFVGRMRGEVESEIR
ncbi:hypothetical protein C8J55DRAFT_557111 [Lentinula edodes]|uniref:Uncharacterized protein n=1 Tax=Lentinula lateritia TaxID=40482 RepID=A0A9W9AXR7_9AGAR|nr:hypothetical protein C8J55DRAFT_557111 [Lentinula edodes]